MFAVTAFAYATMMFQATRALPPGTDGHAGHPLWWFLRAYGDPLIGGELVLLVCLTVAAIGTDEYWRVRGQRAQKARGGRFGEGN